MISVTIVGICITYRSYQCNFSDTDYHIRHGDWKSYVKYTPINFDAFLSSLPLLLGCYICHFNVISVHNEFRTPTTKKIKRTVHMTTIIATLFYIWIGWTGSMYANCTSSGTVHGNILLDFPDGDDLLLVGRTCLACAIAFAFPMMVLPARDTFMRLCDDYYQNHSKKNKNFWEQTPPPQGEGREELTVETEMESREVWANGLSSLGEIGGVGMESVHHNGGDIFPLSPFEMETHSLEPLLHNNDDETGPKSGPPRNQYKQRLPPSSTIGPSLSTNSKLRTILGISCFWLAGTVASFVHSVETVWGLLGSSIAILVGYLIPFLCFIKISHRCGKYTNGGGYKSDFGSGRKRAYIAKVLVLVYSVIMIICTWHAVIKAL